MKKKLSILLLTIATSISAFAQTNTTTAPPSPPADIIQTFENALTKVNTNSTLWKSNLFTIYSAAAFSSVSGTPGQSAIGNDFGLEVPVLRLNQGNINLSLDSATRFEAVFGNVAHQQFGAMANYNYYNLKFGAGLDGRYRFADHHLLAVPSVELQYQLAPPTAVFLRYDLLVQKKTGAGELILGLSFPIGKR